MYMSHLFEKLILRYFIFKTNDAIDGTFFIIF